MIKILLSKDKYFYDIHALVKAFYPEHDVEMGDDDWEWDEPEETIYRKSKNEITITVYRLDNDDISIHIQLPDIQGGGAARPNASTDGSTESAVTEKNALKQALYEALSTITGRTLPWGALTGIRPTKIATQMLAQRKDDNTIKDYLKTVHLVSDEKADFSIEIAHREKEILSAYDYKSGYTLYVGIPFCPTRCSYCSFAAYPMRVPGKQVDGHTEYLKSRYASRVDAYMDALEKEIRATAQLMRGVRLDTVYVGGGTPTALPHKHLHRLLKLIRDEFDLSRVKEYTVEAGRPDSILDTLGKLMTLKEFDVDRICVNPQTFSQRTLDAIGRGHTVEQTVEAFHLARDAGFDNINMDIILGLPGETVEDVRHTMNEIAKLQPDDLTVHSLALKRGSGLQAGMAADAERRRQESGRSPSREGAQCPGDPCPEPEKAERRRMTASPTQADPVPDYVGMARIAEEGARAMGLVPYYLYRQKNMTGNMENTGYARPGKEGLSNILGMEEVQSIVACGCGAITKRVWNVPEGDPSYGLIKRTANVKELDAYLTRVDEMIERKKQLFRM